MVTNTSILIVDDDGGMVETLADVLSDLGYEVGVAEDGLTAIKRVKVKQYDIALIDIRMPGINGVETFKRIRSICPGIKVIMMTAYALEGLIKTALTEGALSVIYKPFNVAELVALIEGA